MARDYTITQQGYSRTFTVTTGGGGGAGDMLAATYDPTSVEGDAFAMDNMVEGAESKILTAAERAAIAANTSHPSDTSNPHSVTATQVGLGNVDDTADADKPISTATQTSLDDKADDSDLTSHTSDTANPHSVTAAQVGLSNVDNTSDANKPISTATQTALDDKAESLDFVYLILAGQSNAVGWDAGAVGISETPTDKIQIWNSIAGTPAWQNFDIDAKTTQFNTRYGGGPAPVNGTQNFAWAAAQHILETTGRPVRVIVEVEGNQAIDQWVPGTTSHWANLESQITASSIPRLDMFMWHQGENDRSETRDGFRANVESLILQIKSLGCFDERTVIAIGELSEPGRTDASTIPTTSFQNFIIRDVVRKANDPFLKLVKTGKVKQKAGDVVHFDAEGLVAGGKLFAEALLGGNEKPDDYQLGKYNPLWDFDAQDGVQYTLSGGTRSITSWRDRTAGLKAVINTGSPVIVNDESGVSGRLVAMGNGGQFQFYPQAQAQTFWIAALVVIKSTDVATRNSVILDGNGSSRILIFSNGQSSGGGELKYSAGTVVTGAVPATDEPIMVVVNFDGASSESLVNGVSDIAGDAGTNGFDGTGLYYMGNSNDSGSDSNIRLVRVAAFAGSSTAAKRAEVESIMRREAGA